MVSGDRNAVARLVGFPIFAPMKRHYWTALSTGDRLQAMAEINHVIDRHAIILNFQRFSDVALGMVLEVEECRVAELLTRLRELISVAGEEPEPSESQRDCLVMLNITFAKGSGNLEIEMPPG